jgi:hypothetical protein
LWYLFGRRSEKPIGFSSLPDSNGYVNWAGTNQYNEFWMQIETTPSR